MNIKIGDKIVVDMNGYSRSGKITNIQIGVSRTDIAGELGPSIEEYDTELKYNGSVAYGDNYWAYFDQIIEVE